MINESTAGGQYQPGSPALSTGGCCRHLSTTTTTTSAAPAPLRTFTSEDSTPGNAIDGQRKLRSPTPTAPSTSPPSPTWAAAILRSSTAGFATSANGASTPTRSSSRSSAPALPARQPDPRWAISPARSPSPRTSSTGLQTLDRRSAGTDATPAISNGGQLDHYYSTGAAPRTSSASSTRATAPARSASPATPSATAASPSAPSPAVPAAATAHRLHQQRGHVKNAVEALIQRPATQPRLEPERDPHPGATVSDGDGGSSIAEPDHQRNPATRRSRSSLWRNRRPPRRPRTRVVARPPTALTGGGYVTTGSTHLRTQQRRHVTRSAYGAASGVTVDRSSGSTPHRQHPGLCACHSRSPMAASVVTWTEDQHRRQQLRALANRRSDAGGRHRQQFLVNTSPPTSSPTTVASRRFRRRSTVADNPGGNGSTSAAMARRHAAQRGGHRRHLVSTCRARRLPRGYTGSSQPRTWPTPTASSFVVRRSDRARTAAVTASGQHLQRRGAPRRRNPGQHLHHRQPVRAQRRHLGGRRFRRRLARRQRRGRLRQRRTRPRATTPATRLGSPVPGQRIDHHRRPVSCPTWSPGSVHRWLLSSLLQRRLRHGRSGTTADVLSVNSTQPATPSTASASLLDTPTAASTSRPSPTWAATTSWSPGAPTPDGDNMGISSSSSGAPPNSPAAVANRWCFDDFRTQRILVATRGRPSPLGQPAAHRWRCERRPDTDSRRLRRRRHRDALLGRHRQRSPSASTTIRAPAPSRSACRAATWPWTATVIGSSPEAMPAQPATVTLNANATPRPSASLAWPRTSPTRTTHAPSGTTDRLQTGLPATDGDGGIRCAVSTTIQIQPPDAAVDWTTSNPASPHEAQAQAGGFVPRQRRAGQLQAARQSFNTGTLTVSTSAPPPEDDQLAIRNGGGGPWRSGLLRHRDELPGCEIGTSGT